MFCTNKEFVLNQIINCSFNSKEIDLSSKFLFELDYKEIRPYLMKGESFLFEQDLSWMLRYYLFGEKYRNLHYDFGDQNTERCFYSGG